MPSAYNVTYNGYDDSIDQLRKFTGNHSALYDYVRRFATRDVVYFYDDFLGDAINLDNYAVANGGGAAVASFATNVQNVGAIRATTGTANDDTASASLIMPLMWYGDLNCGMEARVRIATSITTHKFDVGFIDAVPASNTSGVNDIDTPTAFYSDGAVLCGDTSQTLTTPAFVTKGSTASQAACKSNAASVPNWTSGTTPTVNTYFTVRIQLLGNDAYCWVNNKLIAEHSTEKAGDFAGDQTAGYVEGGVALAPWFYIAAKSATSKSFDIDYIRVWQDRALSSGF